MRWVGQQDGGFNILSRKDFGMVRGNDGAFEHSGELVRKRKRPPAGFHARESRAGRKSRSVRTGRRFKRKSCACQ